MRSALLGLRAIWPLLPDDATGRAHGLGAAVAWEQRWIPTPDLARRGGPLFVPGRDLHQPRRRGPRPESASPRWPPIMATTAACTSRRASRRLDGSFVRNGASCADPRGLRRGFCDPALEHGGRPGQGDAQALKRIAKSTHRKRTVAGPCRPCCRPVESGGAGPGPVLAVQYAPPGASSYLPEKLFRHADTAHPYRRRELSPVLSRP